MVFRKEYGQSILTSLVERKSRYTLVMKNSDRQSHSSVSPRTRFPRCSVPLSPVTACSRPVLPSAVQFKMASVNTLWPARRCRVRRAQTICNGSAMSGHSFLSKSCRSLCEAGVRCGFGPAEIAISRDFSSGSFSLVCRIAHMTGPYVVPTWDITVSF